MSEPRILVVLEYDGGRLRKASSEALAVAVRLSGSGPGPVGVVLGDAARLQDFLPAECARGASRVIVVSHAHLADYAADAHAFALGEVVGTEQPALVLFGGSSWGRDIAPRVAARIGAPCVNDVTSIDHDATGWVLTKPVFAGKAVATMRPTGTVAVITIRPNVFSTSLNGSVNRIPRVEPRTPDFGTFVPRVRVIERLPVQEKKIELTEAEIIVSGGRGLKTPERFGIVEQLASALGAGVGASRAVVDAGWRPHEYQVGQTGKTVSPMVYIACGISGAIQHLAGMSSAKYIIAINKDRDAPIFKVATFGIVGDVFEILPLLTEAVKKVKRRP